MTGWVWLYAPRALAETSNAIAAFKEMAADGDMQTVLLRAVQRSSHLVGAVEITGCEWDAEADCFAYELRHAHALPKPYKPTGTPQPLFWRPVMSPAIVRRLCAALVPAGQH